MSGRRRSTFSILVAILIALPQLSLATETKAEKKASLCTAGERIYFSCVLDAPTQPLFSVCGSEVIAKDRGYLQFRLQGSPAHSAAAFPPLDEPKPPLELAPNAGSFELVHSHGTLVGDGRYRLKTRRGLLMPECSDNDSCSSRDKCAEICNTGAEVGSKVTVDGNELHCSETLRYDLKPPVSHIPTTF